MATAEKYLRPEVIRQVSRLDLRAKFIVEGFLAGLHASPFQARVAVAVVATPLVGVGQDLVRLGRLAEPPLGLLVARVPVGVEFLGLLPIGPLDLLGRRGPLQAEDLVVIALGHRHRHRVSIGGTGGGMVRSGHIFDGGSGAS